MMMMLDNIITADMMREACAGAVARRKEAERQKAIDKQIAKAKATAMAGEIAAQVFNKLRDIATGKDDYHASEGYCFLTFAKARKGKCNAWEMTDDTVYCPCSVDYFYDWEARFYWNIIKNILEAAGFKCEIWTDYSVGYWKDFEVRISWGK